MNDKSALTPASYVISTHFIFEGLISATKEDQKEQVDMGAIWSSLKGPATVRDPAPITLGHSGVQAHYYIIATLLYALRQYDTQSNSG